MRLSARQLAGQSIGESDEISRILSGSVSLVSRKILLPEGDKLLNIAQLMLDNPRQNNAMYWGEMALLGIGLGHVPHARLLEALQTNSAVMSSDNPHDILSWNVKVQIVRRLYEHDRAAALRLLAQAGKPYQTMWKAAAEARRLIAKGDETAQSEAEVMWLDALTRPLNPELNKSKLSETYRSQIYSSQLGPWLRRELEQLERPSTGARRTRALAAGQAERSPAQQRALAALARRAIHPTVWALTRDEDRPPLRVDSDEDARQAAAWLVDKIPQPAEGTGTLMWTQDGRRYVQKGLMDHITGEFSQGLYDWMGLACSQIRVRYTPQGARHAAHIAAAVLGELSRRFGHHPRRAARLLVGGATVLLERNEEWTAGRDLSEGAFVLMRHHPGLQMAGQPALIASSWAAATSQTSQTSQTNQTSAEDQTAPTSGDISPEVAAFLEEQAHHGGYVESPGDDAPVTLAACAEAMGYLARATQHFELCTGLSPSAQKRRDMIIKFALHKVMTLPAPAGAWQARGYAQAWAEAGRHTGQIYLKDIG